MATVANRWRRVDSPAADGPTNMAVDECLLEAAGRAGAMATWRTYTWSVPTLSLGYFQVAASRPAHLAGLPYVRRQTGGGAILHDRELTYSLILPAAHPLAQMAPARLYQHVHAVIAAALRAWGVEPAPRPPGRAASHSSHRGPFLCFERFAAHDLVVGGHKVAGSAQRRRSYGLLQHGSILLAASDHEPRLPGLRELTGQAIEARALAATLADGLAAAFGIVWAPEPLGADEQRRVVHLCQIKYGQSHWNDMR